MKWEKVSLHKIIEKPITGEWGKEPVSNNGVVVIRSTNFNNRGEINLSKGVAIREIPEKKIVAKALREGDIIIEKSGGSPTQPVGRVIFFENINETCLCSNFTSILRPKTKLVFPKYLHYQLFNHHQFGTTLKFQNKTTGIINLQLKRYVEEIQIPLPPLPIQRQIAELLDTATALRQRTEDQLAELDRLAESVFLELFGDPVRNEKGWDYFELGKCFNIKHGYAFKSEGFAKKGEYALLTPGNFFENGGFRDIDKKQKYYVDDFPKEYLLEPGNLLIAMTEQAAGLLGSTLIVPTDKLYLHNQRLGLITDLKNLVDRYLFAVMNYKSLRTQIQHFATGTKVKHTSPKKILAITIAVPPLPLQTHFAQIIENLEAQKAVLRRSLKESEDLVGCLLQGVFA